MTSIMKEKKMYYVNPEDFNYCYATCPSVYEALMDILIDYNIGLTLGEAPEEEKPF